MNCSMKWFFSITCLALSSTAGIHAEGTVPVAPAQFDKLHAMFKTQPGESRFWELPWTIQLSRALARGAVEGKPVLVWCGAGGAPVGVC
jgi:hypothetical protein